MHDHPQIIHNSRIVRARILFLFISSISLIPYRHRYNDIHGGSLSPTHTPISGNTASQHHLLLVVSASIIRKSLRGQPSRPTDFTHLAFGGFGLLHSACDRGATAKDVYVHTAGKHRETRLPGDDRKRDGEKGVWNTKEQKRERWRGREGRREIDGGREYGQSLPRRRGGPVINIPYPLCLGLPLRRGTGAPYLVETLLLLPTPTPSHLPSGRTREKPLKPLSHPRLN